MEESDPIVLDLASMIDLLADEVDRRVLTALSGTGMRRGHGYLIQRLLVSSATATEMAEELGVSQQAVSKAVAELVELGHVEAAVDGTDRRRRPVRLTDKGRAAVEAARTARSGFDTAVRDALGSDGFEQTTSRLRTAMDALGLSESARTRTVRPPHGSLD